jgi:hypothetical protein
MWRETNVKPLLALAADPAMSLLAGAANGGNGASPKMKPDPSVLLIALAAGTPKVNPLGPIEPLHLDSGIARDSVSL